MPSMGKEIHLRLDSLDIGQILDGLRCRQEALGKLKAESEKAEISRGSENRARSREVLGKLKS